MHRLLGLSAAAVVSFIGSLAWAEEPYKSPLSFGAGEQPAIPALIAGHKCVFAINTSSQITTIFQAFADNRGLKCVANKSLGPTEVQIGSFAIKLESVEVEDFKANNGCDGQLGMDVLRHFVVTLDLAEGWAAFSRSAPEVGVRGSQPLQFNELGIPIVELAVTPTVNCKFAISTSCLATGWIDAEILEDLEKLGAVEPNECKGGIPLSQGYIRMRQVYLRQAKLCDLSERHLSMLLFKDNLLGTFFLARYRVTLNFPGKTISLEPSKFCGKADTSDFYGIEFKLVADGVEVTRVRGGSPAAVAGVLVGDIIRSVNGVDSSQFPKMIRQGAYFSLAGLKLAIRRNGIERRIDIFEHW